MWYYHHLDTHIYISAIQPTVITFHIICEYFNLIFLYKFLLIRKFQQKIFLYHCTYFLHYILFICLYSNFTNLMRAGTFGHRLWLQRCKQGLLTLTPSMVLIMKNVVTTISVVLLMLVKSRLNIFSMKISSFVISRK